MADEQLIPLDFPASGLDLSHRFADQPPGTTAAGINVRTYEPGTQRGRGGSRPGLSRYVLPQLPTASKVQCLDYIVDPSGDALLSNADATPPFIIDPSTNPPGSNFGDLNFRNPGRTIPPGGNGVQHNRHDKKSPVVNWTRPQDIATGTALSGTQLNATAADAQTGANLTGTFTYTPPSATVLPTGQGQALNVHFVPDDSAHYRNADGSTTINVTSSGQTYSAANFPYDSSGGYKIAGYGVAQGSGPTYTQVTIGSSGVSNVKNTVAAQAVFQNWRVVKYAFYNSDITNATLPLIGTTVLSSGSQTGTGGGSPMTASEATENYTLTAGQSTPSAVYGYGSYYYIYMAEFQGTNGSWPAPPVSLNANTFQPSF